MLISPSSLLSSSSCSFSFSSFRRPPHSPLFPYTTLFRSSTRLAGASGPPRRRRGRRAPPPPPRGGTAPGCAPARRSEEHTSELQSRGHLVCRLLLEKKKHIQSSPIVPARCRWLTRSSTRG